MKAFLAKIKKWLVVLAVICAGSLIGSQAWAADTAISSPNEGVLDPFTLTVYQPEDNSKRLAAEEEEELINESLMYNALLDLSPPAPLPTQRLWIRVPFRPPVRSPFIPWWM